tara:strand:- start:5867 stop:6082 length:216 start_codon:yes stop_codon:yes gene_type:complete
VTSENDITGQAKKMGRNAGMKADGTLDSVHSIMGTDVQEGTVVARTLNPDVPADGLGNTERSKHNKTNTSY